MSNEEDGSALVQGDILHFSKALLLEIEVAYGEHLVNNEDLGIQVGRNRETKADVHAAGVSFDGSVDELRYSGKIDYLVELPQYLLLFHAHDGAIQENVLSTGELGMKSRPDLEQARGPSPEPHDPARRGSDS